MPRGFHIDHEATRLARSSGQIGRDSRSFISAPKLIEGESEEPKPHVIAYGRDKEAIRREIFRRNRQANGGELKCAKCGTILHDGGEWGPLFLPPEWHHVRNAPGTRCDCPENGAVICGGPFGCHRQKHPQVQFSKTKA